MRLDKYLEILHRAEQLKNNTRHSWTSSGRRESVAEHSWRLALMAYFMKDTFENIDINKVILMCLFHDMGEAFTGDIPSFEKTSEDSDREEKIVSEWIGTLPEPYRGELAELFGDETADAMRVLYGGSMNVGNVEGLMAQPNIDGGLVGGASLEAASFVQLIEACL